MNRHVEQITSAAEGRYFSDSEQAQLKRWMNTFAERMSAMTEIREAEDDIIRSVVDHVAANTPDFEKKYPDGRASCTRDLTLVLRYATHAMVRQDAAYLQDNLLAWLTTILRGIGFPPDFINDTYSALSRFAASHLGTEAAQLIAPFLEECRATLSETDSQAA